jgi:hypothetical protein
MAIAGASLCRGMLLLHPFCLIILASTIWVPQILRNYRRREVIYTEEG